MQGGRLVQLTWQEKQAFSYSLDSLAFLGRFRYNGEGWGLTSDGDRYYMSNGSDSIYVRSPTFDIQRAIRVEAAHKPVRNLNELEFALGKLYANVWYCDSIMEIDPASGAVTRIIDCSQVVKMTARSSTHDVLNGIAFSALTLSFYITGKNWPTIFEISIPRSK
jgi:glutamine cyclotransferase